MKWLALLLCFATVAEAGGPVYCGPKVCGPSYSQPTYSAPVYAAPVHYQPPVTVINNVIGVPVPIAYDKPIALQGRTEYGYTAVADLLPTTGIDYALFQEQSNRLATSALALAKEGNDGTLRLAQQDLAARKDLASQLAIGQVGRELINSIVEAQKVQALLSRENSAGGNDGERLLLKTSRSANEVLSAKCASCHDNYNDWGRLDRQTQKKLLLRMTTHDESKLMPRDTGNKEAAGTPVTEDELELFYKELKR